MCGIAGMIDLSGQRRPVPHGVVRRMANAIIHRGPDEDGYLEIPGLGLANRRLSIVGLADGKQPISNEDKSVSVVFNGELFDYPEMRAQLEAKGHRFRTSCDTEIIPHTYEDHQEGMFEHLRGQFAIALWDDRKQRLILGRDRIGICPLYWTQQGDWLLFASEIKALLASGMVTARPDPKGLSHLFTFFSLPGPVTCFQGIEALTPGHYIKVQLGSAGAPAQVSQHTYWEINYPDEGQEDHRDVAALTEEFNTVFRAAVSRRLRADVPVVSYLSGGVDSSTVVAVASDIRGTPIPSFTIQIKAAHLDETEGASATARHVGCTPTIVGVGAEEVLNTYPELIRAAEGPVVDTSCTALLLLAREVHRQGFKVALTGEGADEWLAGYPWHKVNRALSYLDFTGLPVSQWLRRGVARLSGGKKLLANLIRAQQAVGGHNGWLDIYGIMSLSKQQFFSPWMHEQVQDHVPYEDLGLNAEKMKRWHPLNRELGLGGRAHLPGLLLNAKGDRVSMHSSVETRYPFLDEEVVAFLAKVPPKYKLRGIFGDKYLLRRMADRWVPKQIAWRQKAMFRAPFDSFHLDKAPPFIEQLLSTESLRKTGYFDANAVTKWRKQYRSLRLNQAKRLGVEMGLVGVVATQMWHHTFIGGGLCELPSFQVVSEASGAA